MDSWNHPDRIREPIKVGDIVMLCINDYFPLQVKIIREPVEGDELWYVQVLDNIEQDGIEIGEATLAINPRSSQFVQFVKVADEKN